MGKVSLEFVSDLEALRLFIHWHETDTKGYSRSLNIVTIFGGGGVKVKGSTIYYTYKQRTRRYRTMILSSLKWFKILSDRT